MLKRVLMVDADKTVADGATMLLQGRGYKARAAYSAEEAMTAAMDLKPHALVCDVVLPGLGGVELAEWFAKNMPACKVILISFNPSVSRRAEEAVRAGHAHAFIATQKDLPEVMTILSEIVAEEP